jgi:tetratricopeptide (TPR) repeat protein
LYAFPQTVPQLVSLHGCQIYSWLKGLPKVTPLVGPLNSTGGHRPSTPALGNSTVISIESNSISPREVTESSQTLGNGEQSVQGHWITGDMVGSSELSDLFDTLKIKYNGEVPPTSLARLEHGISPFPVFPANGVNGTPAFTLSVQMQEEEKELQIHKFENIFGPENYRTLKSKCDLAALFLGTCKFRSAEDLYLQVAESRQKTLGFAHLDTLSVYLEAIKAKIFRGKYLEAEKIHRDVHETILDLVDPETELALESTSLMADIFYYLDQDTEADKLRRQVLQIRLNTLGLTSGLTLIAMRKVASMLTVSDQFRESEILLQYIVQLHEKVVGISEEAILHDVRQLADALRDQGRYRESENLFWKIADRSKISLGPDHPDTLWSYCGIAYCLTSQGLFQESERLLRTTYEQQLKVLGDKDPDTVVTMYELANMLENTRRHKEALALRNTIFNGAAEKYGRNHRRTVLRCRELGKCYEELGRYEDALLLYQQFAAQLRNIESDDHPMVTEISSWITELQELAKGQEDDQHQGNSEREDSNGEGNAIEEEDANDQISIEDEEDAEIGRIAPEEDWIDDVLEFRRFRRDL